MLVHAKAASGTRDLLQFGAGKRCSLRADAGELLGMLEACSIEGAWGQREARGWWAIWHDEHVDALDADGSTPSTMPSAYQIDLKGRVGSRG